MRAVVDTAVSLGTMPPRMPIVEGGMKKVECSCLAAVGIFASGIHSPLGWWLGGRADDGGRVDRTQQRMGVSMRRIVIQWIYAAVNALLVIHTRNTSLVMVSQFSIRCLAFIYTALRMQVS
jgi:hypothetical protein